MDEQISMDNVTSYVVANHNSLEKLLKDYNYAFEKISFYKEFDINTSNKVLTNKDLRKLIPDIAERVIDYLQITKPKKFKAKLYNVKSEYIKSLGIGMAASLLAAYMSLPLGGLIATGITASGIAFLESLSREVKHFKSHYDNNIIRLEMNLDIAQAYGVLVHEAVHHFQYNHSSLRKIMDQKDVSPIVEGHARIVEQKVCEDLYLEDINKTCLFYSTKEVLNDLCHAYLISSERNSFKPIPELLRNHELVRPDEFDQQQAIIYGIGSAAMFIAHRLNGKEVIEKVNDGNYTFMRL